MFLLKALKEIFINGHGFISFESQNDLQFLSASKNWMLAPNINVNSYY